MNTASLVTDICERLVWATGQFSRSMQAIELWRSDIDQLPSNATMWIDGSDIYLSYTAPDTKAIKSACEAVLGPAVDMEEIEVARNTVDGTISTLRVYTPGQ